MDKAKKSTTTLALGFAVSILVCFTAAGIGGIATSSSVNNWFTELNKPSWNPPDWIFAPVWSILYLMMAVSAWLVWKESGIRSANGSLGWFAFHLCLNILWSVLFFGLQQPGWAANEIVALWLSIVITMILFYYHSKLAALLLVPYLLWVTFASCLNITIWSINP